MINCIAGKPGGGKSYEAVKSHIIPAIRDKRRVVTNMPLNVDHFVAVFGEEVRDLLVIIEYDYHEYGTERPFSRIEDWKEHEDWKNDKGQSVLFVIDEAHLSLPVPRNSKVNLQLVLEFLSMHRHYGFDVILITQNTKKLHVDVRDMVQLVYRAAKLSSLGRDDAYVLKIHEGCTTTVVNTKERVYEEYVFNFYKSHTATESEVVEASTNDVTPWWKHKSMIGGVSMLSIALLMGVSQLAGSSDEKQKKVTEPNIDEITTEQSIPKSTEKPVKRRTNKLKSLDNSNPNKTEYEELVARSGDYHPFYKVKLSVSGYAEDLHFKTIYFSAQQNGQTVFDLTSKDLTLAGYEIRVLTPCSVRVRYHNYEDYIVCSKPTHSMSVGTNDQMAMNN